MKREKYINNFYITVNGVTHEKYTWIEWSYTRQRYTWKDRVNFVRVAEWMNTYINR